MTIQEEMHTGEKIIKTLKPSPWGYFWSYVGAVIVAMIFYPLLGLIGVFIGFLIIVWIEMGRRGTTYYITSKRLIYEYKFLVRKITSTVYAKVQDLHMTQGIIDRIVGIGKVHINTAGSISVEMIWKGVKEPVAVKRLIEQHIMGKKHKGSEESEEV